MNIENNLHHKFTFNIYNFITTVMIPVKKRNNIKIFKSQSLSNLVKISNVTTKFDKWYKEIIMI